MSEVRSPHPGETRICPHCQGTILESEVVCPLCNRHLRFEAVRTGRRDPLTFCPLHIEGTVDHHHLDSGDSVVVEVLDGRREVISRHVVGVGALGPAEARTFSLRVEVFAPEGSIV